MNILRKNLNLIYVLLFMLCSFLFFVNNANAYNAAATGNIGVVCGSDRKENNCGSDFDKLQLVSVAGTVRITVYSKPFNFIRSDNGSNLLQGNQVPIGSTLNFSSSGSASGTWFLDGGSNDSPDMGSGDHRVLDTGRKWSGGGTGSYINVKGPSTSNPSSITGGGSVSCSGETCRANSVGAGSITVTFPGASVSATSFPKYARDNQGKQCGDDGKSDCKSDTESISYGNQIFTYNFNVYQPNRRPVTSCQGVDNINYTNVRVKWSYSDEDGDAQSFARVQVSNLSDPGFSATTGFSAPILNQQVFGSGVRDYTVNNLRHSTTYNYGIRVNDGKDPSSWVNCGTFTTKVNQPPTLNYTSTTNISYNTATANWTYSDPDGDPQIRYDLKVRALGGREDFSTLSNGSRTNAGISGLRPGTTYIPSIRVENGPNGWTGWKDGPSFTTLANNPPNLDQLSCNGVSTGYTSGKANWNYTGTDEPGDVLVLRLRYKKTTESIWTTVNLPGNRAGAQDIANLISGYGYNIEISLNDNRNVHLGDRWKGCGIFTTTEYPDPSVDFNLTSGSTTVAKGGTITIKTGDPISTNWTITNTVGLQDNSCALSTTGVRDIFRENNIGFESSRQNNNVAADKADQTYTINLSCTGKDARIPKSVNASITLVIQSYPLISCSIVNKVVSTESPTAQVEGRIENANSPYIWEIKRYTGVGENYGSPITSTSETQNFTLDYTGLGLGKYKPVIRAKGTGGRTAEKECSEGISNLGNRSIQEVAK